MRLVVPFVHDGLAVEVRELGQKHGAVFVDLTSSDTGYWALLRQLWADGSGLITCEQDVLPSTAQLEALANCTEGYCTSSYPYAINTTEGVQVSEASIYGLGCAKFSAALLAREHDLFSVGRLAQPVHWMTIDIRLADGLGDRGHQPHRHEAVRHLRVEAMLGNYEMLPAWRQRF